MAPGVDSNDRVGAWWNQGDPLNGCMLELLNGQLGFPVERSFPDSEECAASLIRSNVLSSLNAHVLVTRSSTVTAPGEHIGSWDQEENIKLQCDEVDCASCPFLLIELLHLLLCHGAVQPMIGLFDINPLGNPT